MDSNSGRSHDTSFGTAVVVDATNPIIDGAPALGSGDATSGAELVARWARRARVVKAFNVTGSGNMLNPDCVDVRPALPVASDDSEAKRVTVGLAEAIGLDGFDAGGLAAARDLESLAMLWVRLAYRLGNGPDIAFALLRRSGGTVR